MSNFLGIIKGLIVGKKDIVFVSFLLSVQVCAAPGPALLYRDQVSPVTVFEDRELSPESNCSGSIDGERTVLPSEDQSPVSPVDRKANFPVERMSELQQAIRSGDVEYVEAYCFVVGTECLPSVRNHPKIDKNFVCPEFEVGAIRDVLQNDFLSLAQKHTCAVMLHKAGVPIRWDSLDQLVNIEEYLEFGPVQR